MSKYLEFHKLIAKPGTKTEIWGVFSKNHGNVLGLIKWFGRWRQYAFFPYPETTFNPECMDDISAFVKEATDNHRTLGGQPYGGSHG